MRKYIKLLSIFLCAMLLLCSVSCNKKPKSANITELKASQNAEYIPAEDFYGNHLLDYVTRFAVNILKSQSKQTNGNFNISSESLQLSLALLAGGAQGDTLKEIENFALHDSVLSFEEEYGDFREIRAQLDNEFTNISPKENKNKFSLWFNSAKVKNVNDNYIKRAEVVYGASLYTADFRADQIENDIIQYIAQQTNTENANSVGELSNDQALQMVFADIYKTVWCENYKPVTLKRSENTFINADGKDKKTDFLIANASVGYNEKYKFTIADVFVGNPVDGNTISDMGGIYILMPDEGIDIKNFIDNLDFFSYKQGVTYTYREKNTIEFPIFSIENDIDYKATLNDIGIKTAFTDDADFSGITESKIKLNGFTQKSQICINEYGISATGIECTALKNVEAVTDFKSEHIVFNRPFVYIINDSSRHPIYIGVVLEL